MRRVAALLALAFALAAVAAPAVARPDADRLAQRVAELSEFVRLATGYAVTAPPKIVFKSQEQLDRTFFGANYTPALAGHVGALTIGGAIMLSEDFEIGRDDYILVHELTHFMQHESGKDDGGCASRREPEAYRVQDIFVAATGRGKRSDPFTVLTIAAGCDGY